MTQYEFKCKVPGIIEHESLGSAELEILVDDKFQKGICYRHKNKFASYGTYGATWTEVYTKLFQSLVENGHLRA